MIAHRTLLRTAPARRLNAPVPILAVDSTTVRLTETSHNPVAYPKRTRSVQITLAEWTEVRLLADPADLSRVEGTHGCPDCADGGAEWIALRIGSRTIESRFDYGRDFAEIEQLQARLRELRLRFQ